jgi:hypothetical protein
MNPEIKNKKILTKVKVSKTISLSKQRQHKKINVIKIMKNEHVYQRKTEFFKLGSLAYLKK